MGRFTNADGYASTGQGLLGNNMFAYCGNNPICYSDNAGCRYVCCTDVGMPGSRDTSKPYATVADGTMDMYIVNDGEADALLEQLGDTKDYIIVEDKRETRDNANMKIHNSYLISDSTHQREVLSILINYNTTHPSVQPWTREIDEMEYEWDYHNKLASWGIDFDRTAHVDLDMKDKNKKVFQKGVEYLWEKIK